MRSRVKFVHRRATSWIMQAKRKEISYKQRLITLSLLPLCYREIKDWCSFLRRCMVISILTCIVLSHSTTMVEHDSVQIPSLTLKVPLCESKTFQSSYFNRLVKLWGHVCKIAPSCTFASLSSFKRSL